MDVLELMVKMEVAADDFIIFDTDPDDRHLWTPITVSVVTCASGPVLMRFRTDSGIVIVFLSSGV